MIGPELAALLQGGLAIHVATRNDDLHPNGARAAAVMVDDDGMHLTVYVPDVAAARVLPDLEANGQAAVVFVRPTDDRACQIKGLFVGKRRARAAERSVVAAQWDALLARLEQIGIPRAVTQGWITWPAVAVRLRATAVFDQTPGAGAGAQIA